MPEPVTQNHGWDDDAMRNYERNKRNREKAIPPEVAPETKSSQQAKCNETS